MLNDDQREYIRRAYHLDGKSLRQIARELGSVGMRSPKP